MAPIIEVSDVRKNYGAHKVLEGVDFSVDEGEIFGVLGPNGAGKTTTVECISGLRSYDKGKISVLGHNPKKDRKAVQRVLGAQLQESKLPEKLRVRECLQLFASF